MSKTKEYLQDQLESACDRLANMVDNPATFETPEDLYKTVYAEHDCKVGPESGCGVCYDLMTVGFLSDREPDDEYYPEDFMQSEPEIDMPDNGFIMGPIDAEPF